MQKVRQTNAGQVPGTQSPKDGQRPGRPKSFRTPVPIKKIKDKICKNPRQSMCEMAKEEGMSPRTMRRPLTIYESVRSRSNRESETVAWRSNKGQTAGTGQTPTREAS